MKYVLLPLNFNSDDVEVADIIRKSVQKSRSVVQACRAIFAL